MRRVSAVPVLAALAAILALSSLMACGGGSNTASTVVTQIVLTPESGSLNEGGVLTLSAQAESSNGTVVAADIGFTSSNTAIATVSTGGLICGGTWDANIINCNANGASGIGQATITATATATPSITATALIYVHYIVDSVQVVLGNNCTSMGANVNITGKAYTISAPGCSAASPCDITSTVGAFNFGSNDTSIVALDYTTGDLVAGTPGATTVFGSVSGVNSVGTAYLTCPISRISIHDASSSNTSFVIGGGATQALTADVYDINNQYVKPSLTWVSTNPTVATVANTGTVNNPATITGVAPGTTYITATCSYPDCNKYVPAQYSQNVVTAAVPGGTTTSVYAASTASKMLVPFDITTDTPGTAITLPDYPNSIIANAQGTYIYMGSQSGLIQVTLSSGTAALAAAGGTIEAISDDGNYLLLSDSNGGTLNYFNLATGAISSTVNGINVNSSAYTPDSKYNVWVTGSQFGYGLQTGSPGILTLPYTANAVDVIAEGSLTYITSAMAHEVDIYSTCNQTEVQPLTANAPTLVKAIPNGTGAVAADSPALDVVSTPSTLNQGCPTTAQSSIASYDLGVGSYTAQQLIMSPNSSGAWVVSNLPQVVYFDFSTLTPTPVTLTGNPTPFNGGMTVDNQHLYVGTTDNTVHRIDVSSMSDIAQVAVGLQDSNGNVTQPNLVVVVP